MRLFERRSFPAPVSDVLDGLIILVAFLVALEVVQVAVLLVNPQHPLGEHFRVTTMSSVPINVWPTNNLVRTVPGSASATVEPMAFITFRPSNRMFVLAPAMASFAWWACVVLVLLQLRRVLANMSADAPFPRDNIRRIRSMGWFILGMAVVDLLIDAGMIAYMRTTVTVAEQPAVVPTAMLVAEFPLGTILAGVAVVILAEVFRSGADLQDERALTI